MRATISLFFCALHLAAGCSAERSVAVAPPPPAVFDATAFLREQVAQATSAGGALVVVAGAEWCGPCNELEARFLQVDRGRQQLGAHRVLHVDADEAQGHAIASELHVLGYPTTLVLRAGPTGAYEVGRIEGFEQVEDFAPALAGLLKRTEPAAAACLPLAATPVDLSSGATTVLAPLACLAAALRTPAASEAAARLQAFFATAPWRTAAATWLPPQQAELLDHLRLLGRHMTRVAGQHEVCAQLFDTLRQWPGTPARSQPGALYWQVRCLLRARSQSAARAALETYAKQAPDPVAAAELIADLLAHERADPAWGPAWAVQLVEKVLAAKPQDDWAWYLKGRLAFQAGDRATALTAISKAVELKPSVALYRLQQARFQGGLPPVPR